MKITKLRAIISLVREIDVRAPWISHIMRSYPQKSVALHKDDSMFSWLGHLLVLPVSNARLFGVLKQSGYSDSF